VSARDVIERLHAAQNRHDLEAFLDCFDAAYESTQPNYPAAGFSGREQVRKNWSTIFETVPDFRSELVRTAVEGDEVWSEWEWSGTRRDGSSLHMRGVIVTGIRADRIAWARLYVHPVEDATVTIDEAVERMTRASDA
jgi:ketosteroid isomerase-like protein